MINRMLNYLPTNSDIGKLIMFCTLLAPTYALAGGGYVRPIQCAPKPTFTCSVLLPSPSLVQGLETLPKKKDGTLSQSAQWVLDKLVGLKPTISVTSCYENGFKTTFNDDKIPFVAQGVYSATPDKILLWDDFNSRAGTYEIAYPELVRIDLNRQGNNIDVVAWLSPRIGASKSEYQRIDVGQLSAKCTGDDGF